MEKFSENTRGRPKKFDPEHIKLIRLLSGEKSYRSLMNEIYSYEASVQFISDAPKNEDGSSNIQPPYDWLSEMRPNGKWKRKTILIELGRLLVDFGKDVFYAAADEICEKKPKTKAALAFIRRYKKSLLGEPVSDVPDSYQLFIELAQTIDDYCLRYTATTESDIRESLSLLNSLFVEE